VTDAFSRVGNIIRLITTRWFSGNFGKFGGPYI